MIADVNPTDRNHFIYSMPGSNSNWASFDGGTTVTKNSKEHNGDYYVAIDARGWSYTASQGGAYVTRDNGTSWHALFVNGTTRMKNATTGQNITWKRGMHDYQNIATEFRGDNVAFPSDQGLFIQDRSSDKMINAVGDMHNNLALSALISPSKDGKSRNIVVNLWDWNQAFSIDDGATWRGWAPSEAAPYACGEGGWGYSVGTSGHVNMFHHDDRWHSSDGGYNFVQSSFPGYGGLAFAWSRQAGSRVEATGTVFSLMKAPAGPEGEPLVDHSKGKKERDHEAHAREKEALRTYGAAYYPALSAPPDPGAYAWLLTSENFGLNFTYAVLPDHLQVCGGIVGGSLAVDPTVTHSLYVLLNHCLAHSADNGQSWSNCSTAPGLAGDFLQLVIKSTQIMFIMRTGAVPLKTVDGGATWAPMAALAPLYAYSNACPTCSNFRAAVSWTGKTLVVYGNDQTAIERQEFGTLVWKSTDDGETWTDETGDLVTLSISHGRWYESDFYMDTYGQGVIVKRNFE
jgi:hypothetical protein